MDQNKLFITKKTRDEDRKKSKATSVDDIRCRLFCAASWMPPSSWSANIQGHRRDEYNKWHLQFQPRCEFTPARNLHILTYGDVSCPRRRHTQQADTPTGTLRAYSRSSQTSSANVQNKNGSDCTVLKKWHSSLEQAAVEEIYLSRAHCRIITPTRKRPFEQRLSRWSRLRWLEYQDRSSWLKKKKPEHFPFFKSYHKRI